ncbi:DHHA1 domain-containing protein [Dechloromonas sp. H13]|uniref:DHHA1 domain-containing protein n=1 Tax=Dechloromonas sp. H13 TaxID=2570193 RepID=UPI001290A1F7|nr:DHHA1 domain-containing protein [Dechloromonas sp. H13]
MPAPPVTVLYHADCPDGFGAAYAAWRRFGDGAAYRPLHHGQPWEMAEIAGHAVYILDFSFPPDVLEAMAGLASSVVQIDHHASARQPWADRLSKAPDGSERYRHPALPLTIVFDLGKAGARLAWEYFHPAEPLPLVLRHVEDMDLWRFALPGTRAVSRSLRLLAFDFAAWDDLIRHAADPDAPRYRSLLADGQAIERFFQGEVERLAGSRLVMPARLRGEPLDPLQALRHGLPTVVDVGFAWRAIDGLAINASVLFASEVGNLLAERSGTFGLVWQLDADGDVKCSARSKGNFDVAEIAIRYGGGGHMNAAGFRLPFARFMSEVLGK